MTFLWQINSATAGARRTQAQDLMERFKDQDRPSLMALRADLERAARKLSFTPLNGALVVCDHKGELFRIKTRA